MAKLVPVPGWKGKFLLGPRHSYWWKDTEDSEPRPLSGITSVLNVIGKDNLIQWAANLAAAEAYGYTPPEDFKADVLAAIDKFGRLTSEAVVSLCSKYPDLHASRTAHLRTTAKAAGLGTDAHALIEEYIKRCIATNGGIPLDGDSVESRVNEFAEKAKEEEWTFVASETPLADPKFSIAGTPDFIAKKKDRIIIGDLKTGSGIYDRVYFAQMAAYGYMWYKRVRNKGAPMMVIVHAPSQNPGQEIRLHWSDDWKGDWEGFKSALYLHRWKNNFAKP